ncbi:MAG: TIGR03905 family TSCPD domain-containing protein [Clostridia bacterium]|nr:TIGR03905 family TSCPD domain-containing protein [Clostridia bacterium]
MNYVYRTKGTCSREIRLEMDGDVVKSVEFVGGCHGNLQAISALVPGMTVEEIQEKLSGIRCGFKPTSCPDQLSIAVKEALAAQNA